MRHFLFILLMILVMTVALTAFVTFLVFHNWPFVQLGCVGVVALAIAVLDLVAEKQRALISA